MALRQDGVRLRPKVTVGAPVSKDLSTYLRGLPVIRTSVKPMQRTPDISTLSIRCDNPDAILSEWNASGWFGSQKWTGALVTVVLQIPLAAGGTEDVTVFVGDLDDILEDFATESVELLCIDPLARLKRNTVDGATQGTVYTNESPAYIVQELLTAAGYGSRLTGFAAEIDSERFEYFRIREYTVPDGTWWSAVQGLMRQVNAGLRITRTGLLEYYKFRITVAGSVYTFRTDQAVSDIQIQRPGGDILNSYTAQREDGTGAVIDTAQSPIEDAQSKTDYGLIGDVLTTGFPIDFPADATAEELLAVKAQPPRVASFTDALDSLVVELWDQVTVRDPQTGFVSVGFAFEKSIDHAHGSIAWRVFDVGIGTLPWLFVENNQTLDSSQKVW